MENSLSPVGSRCLQETCLTFRPRIVDIYDKKGGALEFVVRDTEVSDHVGATVAELRHVVAYRNG